MDIASRGSCFSQLSGTPCSAKFCACRPEEDGSAQHSCLTPHSECNSRTAFLQPMLQLLGNRKCPQGGSGEPLTVAGQMRSQEEPRYTHMTGSKDRDQLDSHPGEFYHPAALATLQLVLGRLREKHVCLVSSTCCKLSLPYLS